MGTVAGRAISEYQDVPQGIIVVAMVYRIGEVRWEDDVCKGSILNSTYFIKFSFSYASPSIIPQFLKHGLAVSALSLW